MNGPANVHPRDVPLQGVLDALADPVRRVIVRELAAAQDWSRACGTFDHLGVVKSTISHHFAVLRNAGVVEQRDEGNRRLNRLRRPELEVCYPGLLDLVINEIPTTKD